MMDRTTVTVSKDLLAKIKEISNIERRTSGRQVDVFLEKAIQQWHEKRGILEGSSQLDVSEFNKDG